MRKKTTAIGISQNKLLIAYSAKQTPLKQFYSSCTSIAPHITPTPQKEHPQPWITQPWIQIRLVEKATAMPMFFFIIFIFLRSRVAQYKDALKRRL